MTKWHWCSGICVQCIGADVLQYYDTRHSDGEECFLILYFSFSSPENIALLGGRAGISVDVSCVIPSICHIQCFTLSQIFLFNQVMPQLILGQRWVNVIIITLNRTHIYKYLDNQISKIKCYQETHAVPRNLKVDTSVQ